MSITAAPAELLPASERVARAQATERRRWLRTRWGLSAPAVIIIALFGVLPLLIMVVYSFLEAGEYGGVVWNFSTDAYVSFLFQRDIFDGTLAFSSDYLMIYLRSILFADCHHGDLPGAGISHRLFHGDPAARAAASSGSS